MQTASSGCNKIVTIIIDGIIRSVERSTVKHSKKRFAIKYFCDFWIMFILSCTESADQSLTSTGETMSNSSPERNKAIVLEAFETLFNKRDYAAAERFWSPNYIQHSAHIPARRDCLLRLIHSLHPPS